VRDYLILDVFTDTPLAGNPLAVVPAAQGLDAAAMQAVAREFNLSETVFLMPPADRDRPVPARIFTPGREVPFAGHPTVGAGVALALAGWGPDIVLDLSGGTVAIRAEAVPGADRFGQGRARVTRAGQLDRLHRLDPKAVAACVGLPPGAVLSTTHPPAMASFGLPFAIAELADRAALGVAQADPAAFRAAQARWPSAFDFATYLYVRDGDTVQARMFAPLDGIPEDPATGSAAAALAALLAETLGRDVALAIVQGVEMGRRSEIAVTARLEGGRATGITLEGAAVVVAKGRIAV
jgi:trans-2,3-dihydro-3-hydroxyanthranilate isomerase